MNLVERLRSDGPDRGLQLQAADEIERMQKLFLDTAHRNGRIIPDQMRERVQQFVQYYQKHGSHRLGTGEALAFFADANKLLKEYS